MSEMSPNPTPPKIRFNDTPRLGETPASTTTANDDDEAVGGELSTGAPATGISAAGSAKIRTFGRDAAKTHEEMWKRKPNVTGSGATHVRTFHSKLNNESLAYMDEQINEWLDEHPEYEVKFVNSTIGMYSGKTKEPAIICQVWV